MPFNLYDRVKQKTTTSGSGSITFTSSISAFVDFSGVYADGDQLFYTIENLTDFEVGIGTYSGNTLSRDTILKSSNSDSTLNLPGDSNTFVFATYTASGAVSTTGDRIAHNVDGIDFNPIADGSQPSHQEGRVFYDLDNHALAVYNDEADVTLQVGQEQYLRVRNNTTGTIFNGEAVRIIGSQGTQPTIRKAIATSDTNAQAIGLATHDIESNSFGYITTYGIVNDVNTSAFSSGQEIFLSHTISGGLTGTSPVAPNYKLSLGHVLRSHPNIGSILAKPSTPKLGGGDVKSLGNFQESGIAFIDLVAGSDAAIISSSTGLSYNSGTNILQVDAGGIRFPDGVTQTIAYTGQDSTYTASDGISLNGNNFILDGTGTLDKLTITSGIVFPDGNTQVVAFTGVGVGSATGLSDSIYIDLNNQLSGSGSFKYSGDTAAIDATLTAAAISGQSATTTIADADNFIIERGAALRKVARSVVVTGLATTGELDSVSGYLQGQIDTNAATSGYLQGQIDSNDTDISSLQTATGLLEVRVTQNELDITALETATGLLDTRVTQNTNDISSSSGYLQGQINTNDTDISNLQSATGNLDTRVTQNTNDITIVSGIAQDALNASGYLQPQIDANAASSGYLQSQIDINAASSGYLRTDITALETATGNLDTRVTQNASDITSVSGLLYNNWNISVTGNTDSVASNETVEFTGLGLVSVSYDAANKLVSISGAGDGSGTAGSEIYGPKSGILYFGETNQPTGVTGLIYDAVLGRMALNTLPEAGFHIYNQTSAYPVLQVDAGVGQALPLTRWKDENGIVVAEIDHISGTFSNSGGITYPDGNTQTVAYTGEGWLIAVTGSTDHIAIGSTLNFIGLGSNSLLYDHANNIIYISGSAGGGSYTAGTGLALNGTEFYTAGTGNFEHILFRNGSNNTVIIGDGAFGYDGTVSVGQRAGSGTPQSFINTPNTFVGPQAGWNSSGLLGGALDHGDNTYIGREVGQQAFGYNNVAVGTQALLQMPGNAFGVSAFGYGAAKQPNGNISKSTFLGQAAGQFASGLNNMAIGQLALDAVVGSGNIEIITNVDAGGSYIGTNSYKLNIEKTIVGDTNSKLLAIGNVSAADLTPDATLEIKPNASTDIGLIVQAAASHTANLQEWQDSSENVLIAIEPNGNISGNGTGIFTQGVRFPDGVTQTIAYTGQGGGAGGGYDWSVGVTGVTDVITSGETVNFTGLGVNTVTYDVATNTVSISGTAGAATAAGSDGQIQYNDGGLLQASVNFVWDQNDPTLSVNGDVNITGTLTATAKSFLIDHPSKPGMKLQYASLEGPENGVYVRGTTDKQFISLPDYWKDLVDESSITVSLTSIEVFQPLFVKSKSASEILVGGSCGLYDYVVYAERKDISKLEVEY